MAVRFQNAAMHMITVGKPGGEPIDEPTYHVLSVRFMHAEARPGGRSEGSYIPAGRILLPRAAITTGAYYAFALVAIGAGIWLERHPEN